MQKNNENSYDNTYNYILKLIAYIDIRFGEPITCINITNNNLIIGTIFGRVVSYDFKASNYYLINDTNTENITGIYEDISKLYIVVGDEKIVEYDNNNDSSNIYLLYTSDEEHQKYCDDCYSVLYNNYLFRIMISQPDDNNVTVLTETRSPKKLQVAAKKWSNLQ